jgi:hypothetical protein
MQTMTPEDFAKVIELLRYRPIQVLHFPEGAGWC